MPICSKCGSGFDLSSALGDEQTICPHCKRPWQPQPKPYLAQRLESIGQQISQHSLTQKLGSLAGMSTGFTLKVFQTIAGLLVLLAILAVLIGGMGLLGYQMGVYGFLVLPVLVAIPAILGMLAAFAKGNYIGFVLPFIPIAVLVLEAPFYLIGLSIDNVPLMSGYLWGTIAVLPIIFVVAMTLLSQPRW